MCFPVASVVGGVGTEDPDVGIVSPSSQDVVVAGKTEFEVKLVFVVKEAETSWL